MRVINKINLPDKRIIYYLEVKLNDLSVKIVTCNSYLEKDLNKIVKNNFKERKGKQLEINVTAKIISEHGKSFE